MSLIASSIVTNTKFVIHKIYVLFIWNSNEVSMSFWQNRKKQYVTCNFDLEKLSEGHSEGQTII